MTPKIPMNSFGLRAAARLTACAALLMLTICCAESNAFAALRDKKPNYGRIEVVTTPGSYPILIDGQPSGEVSSTVRYFDLTPGRHTVEIQFPNGTRWTHDINVIAGRKQCVTLNFTPRTVALPRLSAPPKIPCPYPVSVGASSAVNDGDIITFTSDVNYGGARPLSYRWRVTPSEARILSGQGTPTISVDTTGLGRQRVTATVTVDDNSGYAQCRETAFAATNVLAPPPPPIESRRFDEFPFLAFDDVKARLDNYAIELQNNPSARGVVFVYAGRRSRAGEADRLGNRVRSYLVQTRGINPSRITIVNGGYRDRDSFELWIVPPGAREPRPTPTVSPADVRRAATTNRRRQ